MPGSVLFVILVCGTSHPALALRCQDKIVSRGDTKWLVQEVCGDPAWIDEYHEVITQKKENEQLGESTAYTSFITYEIWRYEFGSGRLAYILIFREQTLVDEITEKQYKDHWRKKRGH
jgi:hypothetical protein